jgi:2-keto-4-pentenoate hydratase/2-oxohepta-3-ene-1,7-dioic acid hydratase in catechol pathway
MELLDGNLLGGIRPTGNVVTEFTLLAPIVPASILCIGLNYRRHAEEMKARIPQWPVLFFKNPSALQDPGAPVMIPRKLASTQVDFEGELAIVIGRECRNATRENAQSHVLGYTVANDISARDWQKDRGGSQWCRGKSFDTFCPLGPWIVTADEITDPNSLRITTRVDGEVLQDSSTADMIFDVASLIEFLSGDTTLPAGTVILTGTPEGVGMGRTPQRWLRPGNRVAVEIERIGVLANPVV